MSIENNKEKKLLMIDVVGQLLLLAAGLIFIDVSLLGLILGMVWQFFSYASHTKNKRAFYRARKRYAAWAKFIIIILAISCFALGIRGLYINFKWFDEFIYYGFRVSFVGCAVLYIVYLSISIKHFFSLEKKGFSL